MNTTATDPLVGKTVAQYAIVAKLGGGGMGVVYTARDTKLGRLVALKFLPPQWSHDESAKQRFIREAQAASATDHRNICTIHNIESTDDGQLFIVMAHYEGQTLKQKLEAGALGVDEALEIAAQVAEGLAKAHAQGVVHRDVKPGNLMITEDCVKILDFGLAKFADSLQLTIAGTTVGTVAYMAPEQARGEDADVRSDVWALGVVLYEMLTGQPPFRGAYPEAISYAIRNDPLPPLSGSGREIPEAVERLVLRALEKDPAQRFQSARELARDLRLLQGRSIPLDLRTEPLPPLAATVQTGARSQSRTRSLTLAAAVVLILAIVGTYMWLSSPIERIPIAVAPVANETGYAEIEPYRLALTQTLIGELSDSPNVRAVPYERLLQIVRGLSANGGDPSSREAIQAITEQTAAAVVIVPTLVHENGAWRARAEFRSAATATNATVVETASVVSSLIKDTAYGLMASLARGSQEQFSASAPRRFRVLQALRRLTGNARRPVGPRMRNLDAAAAFERGISAYEDLEYASALRAFASAAEIDPRNPLPQAWQSRVARLMWQYDQAAKAADQAVTLVTPDTRDADALFIKAVSAEAHRDSVTAEARYRELMARYPDGPVWITELAAYQDRQLRNADAIDSYHAALRLDGHLVRPHLELCRLYTRVNEPAKAKQEGQLAMSAYRALRDRRGEGRALWCLSDVLRVGTDEERAQAVSNAQTALKIFKEAGDAYSLPRAYHYTALAVGTRGSLSNAVALWETALAGAKNVGNLELEPLVTMNLGAAHQMLGHPAQAVDYYEQSYKMFQSLGQEQRAAEIQANAGAILIDYGGNPEEGLRDVQNALNVSQKLGNKNFEVFCLQVMAAYYQYAGRHGEAERELNRALALAKERNLDSKKAVLTMGLGRSRFDTNDYAAAEGRFGEALENGSGSESTEARIRLGRTRVRLGDFAKAETDFSRAAIDVQKAGDSSVLLPLLHFAMGELAYESGRRSEARAHFGKAEALWTGLTDAASVEARAYVGLLDALDGKSEQGARAVRSSLEQAHKMGRFSLEARTRVYLARILIGQRKFDDALNVLKEIPPDGDRTLGPELQAQVHYWRSEALAGRGDRAGSQMEMATARKLIDTVRVSLPEQHRDRFASRPDVRLLIG